MNSEELHYFLKFPDVIPEGRVDELKEIVAEQPSFQLGWMLLLKSLKKQHSPDFETYLRQGAIRIPNRRKLFLFLLDLDEMPVDSSDEADYLSPGGYHLGISDDEDQESLSDLVKLIRHKQFMEEEDELANPVPDDLDESSDNEFVTETLARIYINQGLYRQALEAYHKLSLKYPEKNAYFAIQVAEIKKLMIK